MANLLLDTRPALRSSLSLQHFRPAALALAIAGAFSPAAYADEFDTLQFRVGERIQHDNNIFRLSESANTAAVLGTDNRSDTIAVTTAGVKFDKAYGLQRFEIEADAQNYSYQRFSGLNFTALNYAAAWRYSITPAFHGNLLTNRREYVDNTADVQVRGQVNHRTERYSLADGEYEIGARWRAVGGVSERASRNSEAFNFEPNTKVRSAEGGARYVFREGDSVAYRFRVGRGSYSSQPPAPVMAGNFNDREHEFRLEWAPTSKTRVQGRLSHVERSHEGMPARNFSGFAGEVNANLEITDKTSISGGVVRELGSYQTNTESYFEGYRIYVAPAYKATEKITLRARYDQGRRDFKGSLPGFAPSGRQDTIRVAALALEYRALRSLTLNASLQRDWRTSTLPGLDFKNNSLFLSAVFTF